VWCVCVCVGGACVWYLCVCMRERENQELVRVSARSLQNHNTQTHRLLLQIRTQSAHAHNTVCTKSQQITHVFGLFSLLEILRATMQAPLIYSIHSHFPQGIYQHDFYVCFCFVSLCVLTTSTITTCRGFCESNSTNDHSALSSRMAHSPWSTSGPQP